MKKCPIDFCNGHIDENGNCTGYQFGRFKCHYTDHETVVKKKVKELSREDRQQILDIMREGKTVGECCKAMNLELSVVCQVICDNIETLEHQYLRKEAL